MILAATQRYRLDLVVECWERIKDQEGDPDWYDALAIAEFVYDHESDHPKSDDKKMPVVVEQ